MKRSPVTIRRLLAVLVISFLLCGAGMLASAAAPTVDQPGPGRAPVAAARQQADPGTATAPEAPVIDVTPESFAPAQPESVATVSCSGVRLLHGESLTAYTSIQSAISAAVTGDKILVSGGCNGTNYTSDNGQYQTVRVPASAGAITIEGGYDGTDWSSAARDPIAHPTTLNAERQGRVVWVEAGADVTLRDLIIRGGSPSQDGAGIYNLGTLAIEGCTIQDNPSTGTGTRGGGIFSNGTLNVWRSTITGNSVANAGGGIYVYDGTAQIVHSTISGNSVSAGNGGGIGVAGSATVVALLYSTVTDNHAAGGGGIDRYDGTISFKGSIIAGNTGGSSPDCTGTFTSNGYNVIGNNSGCTFTAGTGDQVGTPTTPIDPRLSQLGQNIGPTPTHLLLHGSPAIDAGDESYNSTTYGETDQRGAPRVFNSRMDIGAVEINPTCFATADNGTTVYSGEAGVVQAAVNVATSGGTVKVAGVCRGVETRQVQDMLDDMVSKSQMVRVPYTITAGLTIAGGYDSEDWSAADPVAHPTTLDALGGGRVFYIEQDTHVTLQGLTIAGGHAADGTESSSGDDGGGIYNLGALTLATSTVKNNSAGNGYGSYMGGHGGGIYSGGAIGAGLVVIRTSVISNSTDFQGGGLYLYSSSTIEQSTISGNRSGGDGGGIYNGYGTLTLRFSTVTDNDAYGYNAYGGGVFNYSGRIVNTSGSIIAKNSSYYSTNSDCRGTITSSGYNLIGTDGSCTFNAATGDQVGSNTAPRDPLLSSLGDYGGPTPTHVMADNSPARDAGDPGYNPATYGPTDQRGLPRVDHGRIDIGATELQMNCWATPNDGTTVYASGGSGAVQEAVDDAAATGHTVKVAGTCKGIPAYNKAVVEIYKNVTIEGGYVNGAWGAPAPMAHPTTLDADHAGRGVYIGSSYSGHYDVTLRHLNIINGASTSTGSPADAGGGILSSEGDLVLEQVAIRNSAAVDAGGGIYVNDGTLQVWRSLIEGNTAGGSGGGIYNNSLMAQSLYISDSTLANNTAASQGGALWNRGTGWLDRSTIYMNTAAAGGGLYLITNRLNLRHTILADNTGGNCGTLMFTDYGYNLDSGATCSIGALSNTDPKLGALAHNGGPTLTFKPALDSPAINAGDPGYTPPEGQPDQRLLPRINDGRIDIGAVEIQMACYAMLNDVQYKSDDASALQAAIDAATTDSTIKVSGVCRGVSPAHISTAYIPTNLILEGGYDHSNWTLPPDPARHTQLDADGAGQAVQIVSDATVTLRYLEISHGKSPADGLGGGVDNGGTGALNIENCTISDSVADTSGGGIYSTGALTVAGSIIDGNTAASGGGIYGAAALTVAGSIIDGNTAVSGGGIYGTATLTVNNSEIRDNTSSVSGGGIYGAALITVQGSTIIQNTAGGGGGIAAFNGLTLTGSDVLTNSAGSGGGGGILASTGAVSISETTVHENSAVGCGGGLRNEAGAAVTIQYSTFSHNSATGTSGDGGGICTADDGSALTIKNSTLGGNQAARYGGGIYSQGTTSISTSTLYGNGATGGGAMVYRANGTLSVAGSIFAGKTTGGNCATTITDSGYNLTDESSGSDSCGFTTGAVHQSPNLGILRDNGGHTFTYLPQPGSPAINAGKPDYAPATGETDQRGLTRINSSRIDIGAVEAQNVCYAMISGGAEYESADGGAVQTAINAASAGATIKVAGTCATTVAAGSQLVSITKNLTIEGGYDPANWGAGSDPGAHPTTLDADDGGGRVIFVSADYPNAAEHVTLRNLTIQGGAGTDGGGIYFQGRVYYPDYDDDQYIVEGCTIADNHVTNRGGGVWGEDARVQIKNSTISGNSALVGGGVWFIDPELTIENSQISGNQATDAGGVYVEAGYSTVSISGSTITQNVATNGNGGGLYGWVYLTTSTVSGNTAMGNGSTTGLGGGLYGAGVITYNLFQNNTAEKGGGIYADIHGGPSVPTVRNSTFTGNVNHGIYAEWLSVSHSTFVDNDYYGVWGNADVTHSLFAGTSRCAGAALDLGYNMHEMGKCTNNPKPTSIDVSAGGAKLGPLQDNGGPTLTYKPAMDSPAIDAGDPAYAPPTGETDQRGLPRVNGGRIDIGAVETQVVCWVKQGLYGNSVRSEDGSALQNVIDSGACNAWVAGTCGSATFGTGQSSCSLQGGYDPKDWSHDPVAHPTTLDANHAGRVVTVPAGVTASLLDLNIINGNVTGDDGGGISNAGTLTVDRCTVRDSSAGSNGGGIYNTGSLTFKHGLVKGNTAGGNGGGIYSAATASPLLVSNSTVYGNTAASGGGIWSQTASGTLEMSTVAGNTGGGVNGAATLSVKHTILADNTSANCVGNITNAGYNIDKLATCSFGSNNGSKSSTDPKLGALADNGGATLTMALAWDSPAINGGDPGYTSTSETDQRGLPRVSDGRIDIGAMEDQSACFATITGTPTYRSEDAGAVQMAIDAAATDDKVKISGTCVGVSATYLNTANIVKNLTLEGGYSHSSWSTNNPATYPTTLDAGGAGQVVRIAAAATVTLSKMTITGGQGSAGYGGGVFNDGSGTLTVDGCTIKSNTAGYGAGIYSAGTLMIKNSTIITNTASASGGGIYGAADVTIEGGKIGDTTAGNGNVAATGGGIYSDGYLHLTSTTLGRNRASGSGGGAYVDSHLSITNTQVLNNSAGGDGGGLWGNGGFYVGRSTISSNTAANGGGLYSVYANTPTIEDSTISYNTASGSGGGINAYPSGTSKLWITRTNVSHNSAANGGGIYSLAYWVEIYYSQVEYNTATSNGGGVAHNIYGTYGVRTRYSTFRNNSAGVDGGAIYSADDVRSIGSTFGVNRAGGKGGAIALYRPSGSGFVADISRSTFNDNNYTGTGGSGAVIWVDGGWTLNLDNNIFVNPTSSTHAYIEGSGTKVDLGYNLDRGDTIGLTATGSITNTDPLLNGMSYYGGKNLAYWVLTYLPKQGSPAIDKGDPNVALIGSETDGRGYPRVFGGTIDIGAVEVQDECFATYDDGVTVYHGEGDAIQRAVNALPAGKTAVKVAGKCKGPGGNVALLTIGKNVAIEGGYGPDSWQNSDPVNRPTLMDADARNRVVVVNTGVTNSTLRSLNMTGGVAHNGGGIYVNSSATLFIANSNLYGNGSAGAGADHGGGILNAGALTVEGSAIYSNTSPDIGAGIYNSGNVKIINSTVISNSVALWGLGYRGGGGLYNAGAGVATVVGSTFAGNSAADGANIYQSTATGTTGYTTLAATIITNPLWGTGSSCNTTLRSGGYNRISSNSCVASGETDKLGANIQLGVPEYNGGGTLNLLPQATGTNDVLDVVPENSCRALFSGKLEDQRGRLRPRLGWLGDDVYPAHENNWCDAGAVERGQEIWTVCGPPLDMTDRNINGRCRYLTVADALSVASEDDVIVLSGVVTETVTLDKKITLRGPTAAEATAGTHMGFLQAAATKPTASCAITNSIVTVPSGVTVTIQDLNIRYGCATNGAGINNAGTLILKRSLVYDNLATGLGGGLYNNGAATVTDSTISGNVANQGGGIYNPAGKTVTVRRATLVGNTASAGGGAIYNVTANLAQVSGSILVGNDNSASDCAGTITSDWANVAYDLACTLTGSTAIDADPELGTLRDNGGATLTYAIPANSPAADTGYAANDPSCAGTGVPLTDQRGRLRPSDTKNAPPLPAQDINACDIGAYEYGPRILTVDPLSKTDRAKLLYGDLSIALMESFADDILELRQGTYTGNFTMYHDGIIRHAAVDVSKLSPELGYDLRAILQASSRTIEEQHRLKKFAGTALTVQGYAPTGTTFVPTSTISVILSGLTIRYGAGPRGGGIHNEATLQIDRCAIENNAGINEFTDDTELVVATQGKGGGIYNTGQLVLTHSTVSDNRGEHFGGGLYSTNGDAKGQVEVNASTIAENSAGPIPEQWVVQVTTSGFVPSTLPRPDVEEVFWSGDEIRFEDQTAQPHSISVQLPLPEGVTCTEGAISVPTVGLGLSAPLVCTTTSTPQTVHLIDVNVPYLNLAVTIVPTSYQPGGASIYQQGVSETILDRSIVYTTDTVGNCGMGAEDLFAAVTSKGTNVLKLETGNQSTCLDVEGDSLDDPLLGELQDNNQIDYRAGAVSGFTHTRALLPDSPAIDRIDAGDCKLDGVLAATLHPMVASSPTSPAILAGDIVGWTTAQAATVVFNDSEYNERLLELTPGEDAVEMQFNTPGAYVYRVYEPNGLSQVGWGTITVGVRSRELDQRGVPLPQRGATGAYRCDIGAYEFQPWVVGQPLPRPPSANGMKPPSWAVTGATSDVARTYGLWSAADYLEYAVRPTRYNESVKETATVSWYVGKSDTDNATVSHLGTVVWPDIPQLHVAGALANVNHSAITDGYAISTGDARTYEGNEQFSPTYLVVSNGVFTRTLDATPGDSYSVLPFVKGTQSSGRYRVTVVKTLDWNTAGLRDMRDRVADDGYTTGTTATDCVLGRELSYPGYTDAAGTLKGHSDPEGRPGFILAGTAYDGVETNAELTQVQNTVTDLLPPAHVRELRQGPLIPVLAQAPSTAYIGQNAATGGHDLRVAWYRPDALNVAWPVKTVGYRCRWPLDATTPKIVVASERGSEIGLQAQLLSTRYINPTVYNQTDLGQPGYNPNYEHALMAASNMGNSSPTLYALRTDLFSRDTQVAGKSYATLKFLDGTQNLRIQHKVYRVLLTRNAPPIYGYAHIAGEISPPTANAAAQVGAAAPASHPTSQLTFQVSSGVLQNSGTTTLRLDALAASELSGVTLTVTYAASTIQPVLCAANELRVVERPYSVTVQSEQWVGAKQVVHLRADVAGGTELRYLWDFDDGTRPQYDSRTVSHVYAEPGNYHVRVTVSNGTFNQTADNSQQQEEGTTDPFAVHVGTGGTYKALKPDTVPTHCRIPEPGKLVFELLTQNRHGETGDFKLAEITFKPKDDTTFNTSTWVGVEGGPTPPTPPAPETANAWGPDYSKVAYSITAGNPVYAPVPMRNLLDIQPCAGTEAADILVDNTMQKPLPFWKDWKDMLWARAAGNMQVLYYYPLQIGFEFPDNAFTVAEKEALGLTGTASDLGKCVPWLHQLGTGTVDDPGSDFNIYPVGYGARWPDLPALLNVGETVYQRAKNGVSAVGAQVAVSDIYDDLNPGKWNNASGGIEVPQVTTYLTQLIDPVSEVKVELPIRRNSTPALPENIKTTRLLYGGGLSILGNTDDPNLNLPFSLRSRILFQDAPEYVDGDDTPNGTLVFRGYYDGTSSEYIKGDPLLLLNVMSESDRERLKSLCPTGGSAYPYDGTDCGLYKRAVEDLYWKTRNPRELDLCRNSTGQLSADDSEPATQLSWNSQTMTSCPDADGVPYWRDAVPDKAFLIGVQDANDDGLPEPFEGLGKGKALTAGNAAGTGYITLAYNNDSSLGGLPVSLQVIKVQCAKNAQNEESPYRGNVLVIKSDNLFDEKLSLRHTGDFGGRPDNYEFEWWIAAVDETAVSPEETPPNYPWQRWTRLEAGLDKLDPKYHVLGPEITIEGANPTTLRDNWIVVRYRNEHCPVCGNQYRFSAFAGDPSAKPSQVLGQLAEGWIKRVVSALNPFDTRVDDFVSSPVNASVDMIRQAGPRYEGPVAMNADPENINSMGLIEAYQTVLDRGRALSIDSGVNDQGANAALLNVTSRIAQLYMLLGNDAYIDALDPIVGFDDSTLGIRASAVYAFANQFRPDQFGPIDEELALLRGRDETLGGVAAAPTYNRLTWNFTNGEGEVAYEINYNITDMNFDGFINEADAQIMYPQGHGDSYGQQLTALTLYYQLLKHQNYTWIPRAEPVSVAGAPVVVDYYDERRFAAAAAAKARMGAEVVNLTYRKNYSEPGVQPYRDTSVDKSDQCDTVKAPGCSKRAWGVADWAGRTAEGAYFDWIVANAIIPPVDERYSDVRKIDRTTVEDIGAISDQLETIQVQLDRADSDANPLGLQGDAVLFDLDPALTKTTPGGGEGQEGETHFEQVYDKAMGTVANALKMFVFANQAKDVQRREQDEQHDFAADIITEDRAMVNELIEIFGHPYDKDIGVNGTYPEGYEGPDIYNYDLIEKTDLTDPLQRCGDNLMGNGCQAETEVKLVEFPRIPCLGFYVDSLTAEEAATGTCDEPGPTDPLTLTVEYKIGRGLDEGRGRYLPDSWEDASRQAWGEVQQKLWTVYDSRIQYEQAIVAYDNKLAEIEEATVALKDRYATLNAELQAKEDYRSAIVNLDSAILVFQEIQIVMDRMISYMADFILGGTDACIPTIFGFAVQVPTQCPSRAVFIATSIIFESVGMGAQMIQPGLAMGKEIEQIDLDLEMFGNEMNWEIRQMGRELQGLIRDERDLRLAMMLAADEFAGAQLDYDEVVQRGFRKLRELVRIRQRWAGQIMDGRYSDMAYRLAEYDALQSYRQQFDMAQLYTYMAATAYDYETNLRGEDPAAGQKLIRSIVGERSLGELRWNTGAWDLDPIVGSGGLGDVLGKLRDNFRVLKGQMGFNNPQMQGSRFSMRQELFRLLDSSDASWRETLQKYYTTNIYANPAVNKLAKKPYGMSGPQPGLVIPFRTTIQQGLNYFTEPLGPGDGAYNPTNFSTKIASVGVWFEGYDEGRLARMPYVYLLPAGADVLRPRNSEGTLRYWNVTEQLLPLPYPLTESDMQNPRWLPGIDGLQGRMYQLKPYAAFQAYPYSEDLSADQMTTDTRLIGRSVWNTEWVLVIPGANLLADPELGIDRFMQDVEDIYIYFQTYAYAGTMAAASETTGQDVGSEDVKGEDVLREVGAAATDAAKPMPQPDALFYGVAARDGAVLTSGTLTAILPRGDVVTTEIAPITGTPYNYAISIPLGYYDTGVIDFATGSARVGETIRFTVNGVPALLKDTTGENYQAYYLTGPGSGYVITVDVSGPGSYPVGDVNVSGKRDAADALLVLKYDVGLTPGVTTWPPGPATVYVPLCDVTADGACNSSDALRILLCEVDLASCGPATVTAADAAVDTVPADASPVYLTTEQEADAEAGQIVVRVQAESPYTPLAVASLGLRYDPAQVTVEACAENPAGRLDLAACNPAYASDTVRYTGITTGGIVEAAPLLELRLRPVDASLLEQIAQGSPAIEIAAATLFDLDGNALRPVLGAEEPVVSPRKIFLPIMLAGAGSTDAGVAPAPMVEPTPEPPAEVAPEPSSAPTPEPAVEATPEPAVVPTPEPTPRVVPTLEAQ